MRALTQSQQLVLDVIRKSIDETGLPPTLSEIAAALGRSSMRAMGLHVDALVRSGHITRKSGKARSIQLTEVRGPQKDARELLSAIDAALEEMRVA